jgi:hypothetical protein
LGEKTLLTGGIMENDSISNKKRTRKERDDEEEKEELPSSSRKPYESPQLKSLIRPA